MVRVSLGLGPPSQAAAAVLRPLACGARRGHASVTIRVVGGLRSGGFRRERLAGEVAGGGWREEGGGRRVARWAGPHAPILSFFNLISKTSFAGKKEKTPVRLRAQCGSASL